MYIFLNNYVVFIYYYKHLNIFDFKTCNFVMVNYIY